MAVYTLDELLAPLVPSATSRLRVEVGLSISVPLDGAPARVVRTAQIYAEPAGGRGRWRKVGPVIVDEGWSAALLAIGSTLDRLRDARES